MEKEAPQYHLDFCNVYSPVKYGKLSLFQIGRLFSSPETHIPKHAHVGWFELTVVNGGEGTILTNDVPTKVKKGDIYLSFPGDFHEIRSSQNNPLQFDFFSFNSDDEVVSSAFEKVMKANSSPEKRIFQNQRIPYLIANAISELVDKSKDEYTKPILETIFQEIVLYVVRQFLTRKSGENFDNVSKEQQLAYQIMSYIDNHIYSLTSLSELSGAFSYNYSYLSGIFSKTTGSTISSYYEQRRLSAAKALLAENKLKIKDIAQMLNYSSLYSFSKAFKKQTGLSPKHFK